MITSLSNFAGVTLETDVVVITLADNLTHTYCSQLSWEKDNVAPMGTAKLTMPHSESIEKYWSTYTGTVVIHANLNNRQKKSKPMTPKKATSKISSEKDEKNRIRLQNDNYNYSFIGKVHKIKQTGKTFTIYLEDLGWKFLQKVPDEFRKTYVAGQTLDNAFQAICEFMGVDFAYSIEDLSGLNFAADGYSIEKDGAIIEDTPSIFDEFTKTDDEEETEEEKTEDEVMGEEIQGDKPFEAPGLVKYKNKQKQLEQDKKQANNQLSNQVNNKALNQLTTNQQNESTTEEETQKENEKIEQYQEEFDEKIKDLFKGNTLYDSNVSDPILNYDWITVQPTVTSTSTDSASSSSLTNGGDSNSESNNSSNGAQPTTSSSLQKRDLNGWHNGQYYINGLIYLSDSYINSLSPSEAWAKYIRGQGVYRDGTLNRLRARGYWQSIR